MIVRPFNLVAFRRLGSLLLLFTVLLTANAGKPPVLSAAVRAKVQQAIAITNADERLKGLAAVGAELSLADIAPALAQAPDLKELRERVVFSEAVLARWSDLAPEEAFHHISRLPESTIKVEAIKSAIMHYAQVKPEAAAAAVVDMQAGPARNEAVPLVAEVWARTNVQKALAWAQKLPGKFPREPALYAIRFIWVHSDPVSAAPQVMALPADETRNALLMDIAGDWAAFDPPAAWKWATSLPAETAKDLILNNVIESWADTAPRTAIEFALQQPEPLRERLGITALDRWATQNPQQAMQWLFRFPDEPFQVRGTPEIMNVWASVNPAEAGAWVRKLPAGSQRDIAIYGYVNAAGEWDPATSIALAAQLGTLPARLQCVQRCLGIWLPRQPEEAQKWIEQSDFSEEIKADWRKGNLNAGASPEAVRKYFSKDFKPDNGARN